MKSPVIIAMKGSPSKAKRKLAISVAEELRYPFMDPDDLFPALKQCLEVDDNLINVSYEAVLLMAQAQLQLKFSLIVNSPLSDQLHFDRLVKLAASNDATLLLIDCRTQEDEYFLPDYDAGNVNKLIIGLNTDVAGKELVSRLLHFIASGLDLIVDSRSTGKEVEEKDQEDGDEKVLKDFAGHPLVFCDDNDQNNHKGVSCEACQSKHKGVSCKACLKPICGPIYSCIKCRFYLHKSCLGLYFCR